MADVSGLEKSLNEIFGEQAPKLPEGGKKFLVQYAPYLVLIGGILSLFGAWGLWNAARTVNKIADWANELSQAYGGTTVSTSRLTVWVWLGIAFMVLNAVLYLMAYKPLKAREKRGWDLVFYVTLLSVAYSVVSIFINGQGFGSFVMGMIGVVIGLWLLFQIRPAYLGKKAAEPKAEPKK